MPDGNFWGSATISLLLEALSGSDQPSALAQHVSDQALSQGVKKLSDIELVAIAYHQSPGNYILLC